jgi:hypothetical protein
MKKHRGKGIILVPVIEKRIYFFQGKNVMFDKDLAILYGVDTKVFNQAVQRNLQRFPKDFMFQLTAKEFKNLRSQFVTSSWGGRRYLPFVFTEMGVAMLSSVLNSERAIQVNIQIMRAFTALREIFEKHKDLKRKIEKMERKYDQQFKVVFDAIRQLLEPKEKVSDKRYGFLADRG